MSFNTEQKIGERMPRTEYEIDVPESSILRHPCHQIEPGREATRLQVVPADQQPLLTFETPWYLANIGTEQKPLFLELRLATLSPEKNEHIALLMTTERGYQIRHIAQRMIDVVEAAGIEFNAALGIPALGTPLAQAMGDIKGPEFYWTTCQKGRADSPLPKPWLDSQFSYRYQSGTKPYEQVFYLDPVLVDVLKDRRLLIVDDARLSGASVEAMVRFLQQLGLNLAAIISVLNEADLVRKIEKTLYFYLDKIPIFSRSIRGYHPIEGTFEGVSAFYIEQ